MLALAKPTERDYYTRAANEDFINGGPRIRTKYLYDQAGHLIAETSDGGTTYTEYLWLQDTPVAVIKPGSANLYYIHTDHLDTPRLIANQTPTTVWRWDNDDPFGANMANANPSGLGTFAFNLRLPGQYFDSETNYHYNYYRDYSPEIGRYVEADPLGVVTTPKPTTTMGLNHLYAYVTNNPLSFVDPLGLELNPGLKGELGSSLLESLTGNAVEASAKNLGQAIGAGLQGKTGQQGCRDACTEKCLQIINQAAVYFRNEVLFGCIEGCIPKCNECP